MRPVGVCAQRFRQCGSSLRACLPMPAQQRGLFLAIDKMCGFHYTKTMRRLDKINRKLRARFGGQVAAFAEDGCLVLRGRLKSWDDIVAAGQMAADRRHYDGLVNDITPDGFSIPPMHIPDFSDNLLDGRKPDVLVVGGGVIGCAIARELSRYALDIILVEKEHDVAMQTSSRNDGMVHPGIDLHPGQSKFRYNRRGNRIYDQITEELGVPFVRSGQYLCFRDAYYIPAVLVSLLYWKALGFSVRFLTRKQLHAAEPRLASDFRCALYFAEAGVVCPYGLTIAYAENAVDNGVLLSLDTAVTDMELENGRISAVRTNRGTLHPRLVVNAAGVFSDKLAAMAGDRFFSIHPRRGTNSILDKKVSAQVLTIASAMRSHNAKAAHTKGGGIVRTVDGNLLVGPDAHETYLREDYSTDADSLASTFEVQKRTSPALSQADVITCFTGVRAATYEEDFVIRRGRRTENIIHAAGIQSPGLTAAPAIAQDVAKLASEMLGHVQPNLLFRAEREPIVSVRDLPDAERDALISTDPDYGEIVCRCEQISRGEIRDALRRSVPCDTLDGVKRRVRPGMGRCQGGFCGPIVLQMIAELQKRPCDTVEKGPSGSCILLCRNKEEDE